MLSVGTDFIEIARLEQSMHSDAFLRRVFGPRELIELRARQMAAQSAAAAFAAKEAFSKALGTGVRGFSLYEVELLHDGLGAPYFAFSGRAEQIVKERGLCFSVSVTHTDTLAGAIVAAFPGEAAHD